MCPQEEKEILAKMTQAAESRKIQAQRKQPKRTTRYKYNKGNCSYKTHPANLSLNKFWLPLCLHRRRQCVWIRVAPLFIDPAQDKHSFCPSYIYVYPGRIEFHDSITKRVSKSLRSENPRLHCILCGARELHAIHRARREKMRLSGGWMHCALAAASKCCPQSEKHRMHVTWAGNDASKCGPKHSTTRRWIKLARQILMT